MDVSLTVMQRMLNIKGVSLLGIYSIYSYLILLVCSNVIPL